MKPFQRDRFRGPMVGGHSTFPKGHLTIPEKFTMNWQVIEMWVIAVITMNLTGVSNLQVHVSWQFIYARKITEYPVIGETVEILQPMIFGEGISNEYYDSYKLLVFWLQKKQILNVCSKICMLLTHLMNHRGYVWGKPVTPFSVETTFTR